MKLSQTHNVRIPPATDIPQMIGAYAALLSFIGVKIPEPFPFPLAGGFTHPIPEENTRMTADFMNTKTLAEALRMRYINLALEDIRVSGSDTVLVMTFSFDEVS